MKSARAALLSCLLVFAGLAAGQAEDGKLRTVLEGRYAAMKAAMASRDANAVAALLAPDFVSVDISGGEKTGAEMIDALKGAPADADKASKTTLLSVESDGRRAVVRQQYVMKTVKLAADGARHQVELTVLSTDAWVSADGTWLMQRTATEQIDYLIDGRSLVHKVRPSGT